MSVTWILRQPIAIGRKIKTSSNPYGSGENFLIEVGFSLVNHNLQEGPCREALLARVLARIDHKALGVDVHLGFEPTLGRIAQMLFQDLKQSLETPPEFICLKRGDGVTAHYREKIPGMEPLVAKNL